MLPKYLSVFGSTKKLNEISDLAEQHVKARYQSKRGKELKLKVQEDFEVDYKNLIICHPKFSEQANQDEIP